MKRTITVILILLLVVTPIFTCGVNSIYEGLNPEYEKITTQQATEMIEWIDGNKEAWNKVSCIYLIKQMVEEKLITEDNIRKQFGIDYNLTTTAINDSEDAPRITGEADTLISKLKGQQDRYLCLDLIQRLINGGYITKDDLIQKPASVEPSLPTTPVKPNANYASLEIIPEYGYYLTKAGGHIYSIATVYDDMEESITYVLKRDNKVVYTFDEYWGPRGIIQINSTVYVATVSTIYKYSNNKLTKVTEALDNIMLLTANGKDMYVACDDDSAGADGSYYECNYYKVSTSGKTTVLKGGTSPIDYMHYNMFSVNKSGDRLAAVPFQDEGTTVRNLSTGKEYFQRDSEEDEPHAQDAKGAFSGEYSVVAPIYYNDCLIVNVKGSLVYYDSRNKPHVILGNMKSNRLWYETWQDTPSELWPIKRGIGNKVAIGYVLTWTLGDDGYIYGIAQEDYETNHTFKLALPDSVKKVVTYKKTK